MVRVKLVRSPDCHELLQCLLLFFGAGTEAALLPLEVFFFQNKIEI